MAVDDGTEPLAAETDAGAEIPEQARRAPTSETPPPGSLPTPEVTNLVDLLSEEERKSLADRVIRDYDSDVRSRSEHMKRLKKWYGLYASVMRAKSHPFQNAANVNLPTLTYPLLQTAGRIWDMMVPANGHVLYSMPIGPDDYDRAHATETFGNWYLRYRMPEWASGLRDTIFQTTLFGSAFRRIYWDEAEGRVRADWIPIDDFVVAYSQRSQDPCLRDVRRYTLCQWLTIFDIEDLIDAATFADAKELRDPQTGKLKAEEGSTRSNDVRETADKIDGQTQNHDDSPEDQMRLVLEQHRIWRMPKHDELGYPFDGKGHPVMVTVDEKSRAVLRLVLREQEDPADASRYERQVQEKAGYEQAMVAYQAQVAQMQAAAASMQPQIDPMTGQPATPPPPQLPPPPVPPPWLESDPEIKPPKRVEVTHFVHYRFFPGEGFYGIGLGDILGPLADAVNTLVNQYLNWIALRNQRPGVVDRNAKMQRGVINLAPGELTEIDTMGRKIDELVQWMNVPEGDRGTMPMVQWLQGIGDRIAGISSMMSGEGVGANRTAKEAMILAEQSLKQLSIAERGTGEAEMAELTQIWRRWAVFLSDAEIYDVVDVQGQPTHLEISRDMFRLDAHVLPSGDPRTKMERMEDAQQLFGFVNANPMLQQSPQIVKKVTEEVLKSLGAVHLIPFLPQTPPPGPPPPPPPRPHWEEDADFLREKDSQPHPDDNDEEHLAGHAAFESSPAAQRLTKPGRDMLERHIRFHQAQHLNKVAAEVNGPGPGPLQGANNGPGARMGGPVPGGGPGMAVPPGNAGVPSAPPMA